MSPEKPEDVLEITISSLSATGDDALSKAAAEGFPDRDDVISWAERTKTLVLHQRDRSALRAELSSLSERLIRILRTISLPQNLDAESVAARFLKQLPTIRALLSEDVEAAFEGDPAAKSYAEIVAAYPAIQATAMYRLAHGLYGIGVPLIPRIMSEHAHTRTGIDIHPGAKIGRRFFIDHGTGVVIGETCEIGSGVRIYQGVTLGALSPRRGQTLRGAKRHPTIEDDVTIYPGATILGGETVIGRGSVIGGNSYLTQSIPPASKVLPEPPKHLVRKRGAAETEDLPVHWDI